MRYADVDGNELHVGDIVLARHSPEHERGFKFRVIINRLAREQAYVTSLDKGYPNYNHSPKFYHNLRKCGDSDLTIDIDL